MVEVTNRGSLPAQIGAHMRFDRLSREVECRPEPPAGARLLLPAGTSVRIEPGATVEVEAVWS
jgi:urease beta subunit